MALACATEGYALVEGDITADDGGFTNDDAHGVVDKQSPTKKCAGMNVNTGKEASDLRKEPRGQAQLCAPQYMGDAIGSIPPTAPDSRAEPRAANVRPGPVPKRS